MFLFVHLFIYFLLWNKCNGYYWGILQSDLVYLFKSDPLFLKRLIISYNATDYNVGIRVATVEIGNVNFLITKFNYYQGWDAFEPNEGQINRVYVNQTLYKMAVWRNVCFFYYIIISIVFS